MLSYCLKHEKKTESRNSKIAKTKKGKLMLLSKCAVRYSKKSRFIKDQEASGLLSSLETRTGLDKFPIVGPILF